MKGLGAENPDVPQRRMVSTVLENPSWDRIVILVSTISIKERKYANILSTMSTTDIDAVVNVIKTIGKKS
ncbi:hypothetical protein Tco_0805340 [Tanacetum coccineum]